MGRNKYTTISIPEPLADRLREFIDDTGFNSMSDFVTFMLREVLVESAEESEDRRKIKAKLKALGYLD